MLAATAATNSIPDMVKRFPNMFFFLGLSSSYAEGLAALLKDIRDKGQIGNAVALTGVADQFGIEMLTAARPALREQIGVLLVEQNAARGLEIADRGYILSGGRIVGEGSAAALRADPAVARAYLGAAA